MITRLHFVSVPSTAQMKPSAWQNSKQREGSKLLDPCHTGMTFWKSIAKLWRTYRVQWHIASLFTPYTLICKICTQL